MEVTHYNEITKKDEVDDCIRLTADYKFTMCKFQKFYISNLILEMSLKLIDNDDPIKGLN